MIEVEFYETSKGKCPVAEFLDSLTGDQAQKIAWVIELIQSIERPPVKFFKKLVSTDGLWEIRVEYQGNIFRLLAFFDGGKLLVANHGFVKKTQKTPKKEIKVAEERKLDYFKRKGTSK
jgi:phage-related protein